MDDKTLETYAFIHISSYRTKAVLALMEKDKTPTQIAKESDIRVNHMSKVLRELKERGVVKCINEEKRKNRIYTLTDFGRSIGELLK